MSEDFRIDTSGRFYNTERKEKLETLGFKFTKNEDPLGFDDSDHWYREDEDVIIEMSWDQIPEFIKKWGHVIISLFNNEWHIEIYDDYRE